MTNFKSGSGNLDFDGDDAESSTEAESSAERSARTEAGSTDDPAASGDSNADDPGHQPPVETGADASGDSSVSPSSAHDGETYPYFVRRSNVGDERDTRLEIHVRDKVAEGEAEFRHALAAELGASDVAKTDAREFALLAAFRHPERVAELMREEGFDSL